MTEEKEVLPESPLPDGGLKIFYRITLWREINRIKKDKVRSWKKAIKRVKALTFSKNGTKGNLGEPQELPSDTMYLPKQYNGKDVLRELRNAFCHNGISYDNKTEQYEIRKNKDVHIAGKFSFIALQELVEAILSETHSITKQGSKEGKK